DQTGGENCATRPGVFHIIPAELTHESGRLGSKEIFRQFSCFPEFQICCYLLEEMPSPIRILTAVPICDGHDSAINTINLEFIRHGIEVIYLGYHRSVGDIVRAAIQEDVRAIGISSYNGGHIEFFAAVVDLLRKKGADDIKVFGGGGGTITHDDAAMMRRKGVDEIFFAGTSLDDMVKFVHRRYGKPRTKRPRPKSFDQELAQKLSEIEEAYGIGNRKRRTPNAQQRTQKVKIENRKSKIENPTVIGFTGPGGAGKTTLIDEL